MAGTLQKFSGNYETDAHGQIILVPAIDVTEYNEIHVELLTGQAGAGEMMVRCSMGVLNGATPGMLVSEFLLGAPLKIYSIPVVGPEFSVVVTGGSANTSIDIQGWIFYR